MSNNALEEVPATGEIKILGFLSAVQKYCRESNLECYLLKSKILIFKRRR
jgi:hypothetical protein